MFYQCHLCEKSFNNILSLNNHFLRTHKGNSKELYLKWNNLFEPPKCLCGCLQSTRYLGIERGFNKFIKGHEARVQNNFHKNPETFKKSLNARRKMIADGVYKPFVDKKTGKHWSIGLTAESDERIAKMAESIKNNSEEIKKRSERMKENRLNGIIPTLYGENHSQWKGGITSLNGTCRVNKRLYYEWKYPKLLESKFTCYKCNKHSGERNISLEVHHDKETFSEIMRKIAFENGWKLDFTSELVEFDQTIHELKNKISDEIANYHIKNNVSGIVLCQDCHKLLHKSHNF